MSNMFTALAYGSPFNTQSSDGSFPNNQFVPGFCTQGAWNVGNGMIPAEEGACPYVDPNPVESINGEGHNYFRSKHPYKLRSYALFGEAYCHLAGHGNPTYGPRHTHRLQPLPPVPPPSPAA